MSYDPDLHIVYIGTGNAAPYQVQGRNPGGGHSDDLYASSIVALDARTGLLVWYFQTTPGDNWDQDAISPFVQADLEVSGRLRRVIMQAPKNGFFYVLDRRTGELVSGKPFTYVNWSRGLDAKGRPILTKESDYTKEPQLIYPSSGGGHSWMPMAYSPKTRLVYIPVIDAPMIWIDLRHTPLSFVDGNFGVGTVFPDKDYNPQDWDQWFGRLPDYKSANTRGPRRVIRGVLRAWDPVAQRVVWDQQTSRDYFLYDGGVLATAGNLVFQGRGDGSFVAYTADTGKILTKIETGVGIMAAPMSYEVAGVQYVAVMEGYGGGAVGISFPSNSAGSRYVNEGRILVFRLDAGPVSLPPVRQEPALEPPPQKGSIADIARGSMLYATYCGRCHVFGPGVLPDLRRIPAGIHDAFEDIVLGGQLAPLGMGRFDDVLNANDVSAIHAYLVSEAWKMVNEQKPSSSPPSP
jgi:quinohemoprotein ethanol dehydrogenase